MSKICKIELILEGLDCANCAAKIESNINRLEDVYCASMNFVTKILTIETKEADKIQRIITDARNIIKKLESHVIVQEVNEKKQNSQYNNYIMDKNEMVRLIIGAILFVLALIVDFSFRTEFILYFTSYLLVGGEVVLKALKNATRGQLFDENFLMSIATIGAFGIKEFPEAVAVMLFYQIGELFQDLAVNRSRRSITDLMDIRPDFANLKVNDKIKRISPEEVNIGDIIIVKPGEKVPLDGKVIEGISMVDSSALTGESLPREVQEGSDILSGFINKNGVLTIEVTKEFGESTVSKILDLVQNASSKKAPTENFITKFARHYTPVVVFSALSLAVIPPLIIPGAVFSDWFYRALIFLVVSCPCALVVSIPLSFFGGIGGASKNGILIKGSNYLEALNNVDTVVFDKTGTLTKGVFNVTGIYPYGKIAKDELIRYAAFAESYSLHPIATSILKVYGKKIDQSKIESYDEISGYGIKVAVEGKEIFVGNEKLMLKENISFEQVKNTGTILYIAIDRKYSGYIVISDEIKNDSKSAVNELKDIGVKTIVMLTGDRASVGFDIAKKLGIDNVHADLLPHQKVEKVEELEKQKSSKGKLIFVGDGINDAPVLARADIGIAMGGLGSDAAIEAADVVLMTDEPSKLTTAIKIAKRTKNIIWQNIYFALGIKGIVLLLGAGGIATMWGAVFADVGVALIAVLNAMRVMKVEKI